MIAAAWHAEAATGSSRKLPDFVRRGVRALDSFQRKLGYSLNLLIQCPTGDVSITQRGHALPIAHGRRFAAIALRWFKARGVKVARIMTDNVSRDIAKLFRRALQHLSIRHIRTKPYTPQTDGKAERFTQTMLRERAYVIPFKSSLSRETDLPRWLD